MSATPIPSRGDSVVPAPYQGVVLAGDEITDILLPEEGKHRLTLAKEIEADEPLARVDAISIHGGVRNVSNLLKYLDVDHKLVEGPDALASFQNLTHWHLKLFPKDLFSSSREKVYRVFERHLHTSGFTTSQPLPAQFTKKDSLSGHLLVVADYSRQAVKSAQWEEHAKYFNSAGNGSIRTMIMLGSRLPHSILYGRPHPQQLLWHLLLNDKGEANDFQNDTLVITNIDLLRQEGARISKRKSWDLVLNDFSKALTQSPPLRRLATFGHLIVRIGAAGAFYHRRARTKDAQSELTLIYDPMARGGIFRDLIMQGNVFSTRAAFAACVTKSLISSIEEESLRIKNGIADAIKLNQDLFSHGFGKNVEEIKIYPHNVLRQISEDKAKSHNKAGRFIHMVGPKELDDGSEDLGISWGNILMQNLRCEMGPNKSGDAATRLQYRSLQEIRRLKCAIRIVLSGVDEVINRFDTPEYLKKSKVQANSGVSTESYFYLELERAALELYFLERVDIETEILSFFKYLELEWKRIGQITVGDYLGLGVLAQRNLLALKEKITDCVKEWAKIEKILNGTFNQEGFKRSVSAIMDYARSGINLPDGFDLKSYESRLKRINHSKSVEGALGMVNHLAALRTSISKGCLLSVPYNFPIAKFGNLTIAGRKETEAYNDIRNRILYHFQSGKTKPLSLAVFGEPGNGKSFGVKEISKEVGGDKFEAIECNLSQAKDIKYLDGVFLKIADTLAKKKVPLVFFDEFDAKCGEQPLGWLKYFLQPMEDGYYNHSDGLISVGNSIFVFIGGTHKTYESFSGDWKHTEDALEIHEDNLEGTSQKIDDAIAKAKEAKLPDFVSRLKGFVNIPDINPSFRYADREHADEREIPYIRRAIVLRSLLVKTGVVSKIGYTDPQANGGKALIDIDLIRAFLMVKNYKHGVRSMSTILDISFPFYNAVVKASLPIARQLEMYTDSDDFTDLLEDKIENGVLDSKFFNRLISPREDSSKAAQ